MYTTTISLLMSGEHHSWSTMNGTLTKSIGIYDAPTLPDVLIPKSPFNQ